MKPSPARSVPVRIGVIGCGAVAYWKHLRELRRLRGARLVAAADPDPIAREAAARLTGVPIHTDPAELLAERSIDAVIISAPNVFHADLAVAAAQAGKHFYLEKPIAIDLADARRVIEAARGVITAMGFNRRCHPVFEQARALISAGEIVRIHSVHTVLSEPFMPGELTVWRRTRATGGGVLLDLASHHIDLLRWLLADEVVEVEARLHSEASEQDSASLRFSMRNGTDVRSFFSYRSARADSLEIIGERGVLRLDRHRWRLSLRVSRRFGYGVRSRVIRPSWAALQWQLARLLRPSYESSYRRALSAFVEMCHGGVPRLASLEDGLRTLEIILAAEESARVRTPIGLTEPGT